MKILWISTKTHWYTDKMSRYRKQDMIDVVKKYKWHGITVLGILLLIFMHLYRLTEVPYGLNVDEASGAYDALNIARYGVDRYLKSYPVYFTNYGDGQNALYIYATAILIKIFGVSKAVIRMTAAVAAMIAAIFGWQYMNAQWEKRQGKVVWLLLYAAIPVFTMTQRFGLESHLMLPMSMMCLYLTAKALDTGKWRYYLLAGTVLGITLYTYALSYIVIPVFLLLILIYAAIIKKLQWKKLIGMATILAVLAAPLILVQAINFFDLPEMKLGPFTFTKLLKYRVDEVEGVSILQNIKSMFVSTFLYDDLTYNTLAKYGTMFYVSIPFVFLGFCRSIYEGVISVKEKKFSYAVPMVLWFVAQWGMGSLLSGHSVPNSTRMIGVFMPMLYFLVRGLYFLWDLMKKEVWKKAYAVTMSICYSVFFLHFAIYYFTGYNEEAFPMKWLFYESYEEVGDFLEDNRDASWYDRSMVYPWNYIYYALEYQVNPYELNLPVNGKERFGKDYINEFEDNILIQSNYVIFRTDQGSKEFLSRLGFEELKAGDNFSVFVSPLDSYEQTEGTNTIVSMDDYRIEGDWMVLSGWCADSEGKLPYTEIILVTEQARYIAQLTERPDVATHLETQGDANYGFAISLPLEIFRDAQSLRIWGTNAQGTQEDIYIFERK